MAEDIQKRLFGACAKFITKADDVEVDINALIRRFLLFDTYIIHSFRFKEFSHLIRHLGYDFVTELLKSGGIRIHYFPFFIGQRHPHEIKIRSKKNSAILGPFTFQLIKDQKESRTENISLLFREEINSIQSLALNKKKKLKRNIIDVLETPPDYFGEESLTGYKNDLIVKTPLIKAALLKVLEESYGKKAEGLNFFIKMHRITENNFEAETNLGHLLGLEDAVLREIYSRHCSQ